VPVGTPLGELSGIVWFDADNDHQIDSGEPRLPGVPLDLEIVPQRTESRTGSRETAPIRWTTFSASDGSYSFTQLPYGRYRVSGEVPPTGIIRTWDPQDIADWQAVVEVAAEPVVVSLAAIGAGEITGTVVRANSGAPVADAVVTCDWSGVDGVPGGADQVSFGERADSSGRFTLSGVPYGIFACTGVDPARAESMSPMLVSVGAEMAPALTFAVAPTEAAAPTATVAPVLGLPVTGLRDSARLLGIAMLLIGLGVFLRMLRTVPTPAVARRPRG
jgi:hypothetical protein